MNDLTDWSYQAMLRFHCEMVEQYYRSEMVRAFAEDKDLHRLYPSRAPGSFKFGTGDYDIIQVPEQQRIYL